MKIIVTGGAGFIGGNFVHHMVNKYPEYQIINLDLLTYAGNLETLKPVEEFCSGEPCRPLHYRSGGICEDECNRYDHAVRRVQGIRHSEISPGIHRRGLRGSAPRQAGLILYGGDAAPYFEPIFLLEGKRRSVCACVPQDLRTACDGVQMLQQLRSVSFPGETDSAYDQPGPGG